MSEPPTGVDVGAGRSTLVRGSVYPRSAVASLLLVLMCAAIARAVLIRQSRAVRVDPPIAVLTVETDDGTARPEQPGDATSPTGAPPQTVTHDSDDEAPDLLPRHEQAKIALTTVRLDDPTDSAEESPQGAEVGGVPQRFDTQAPPVSSSSAPVVDGPGAGGQRRTDLAAVHVWARANGYTVADRGRIAAAVLAAYDQAH